MLEPPGPDPFEVFERWYDHARRAGQPEPEAMALATSTPAGRSSVRFLLLRGFDRRGFVFYTNRRSRKGEELGANPQGSLAFRWHTVDRQVRAVGKVEPVEDTLSDRYFAGRPRGSQLSAWASEQSQPVRDRAELDERLRAVEERFGDGPVPRPPWWGGYRLVPDEIEFWQQGTFRLHDRFEYRRNVDGTWASRRLSP